MDTAAQYQWPQGTEVVEGTRPPALDGHQRRINRPQKELSLNCPRCNSSNTKFCYYNNYSLSQPRYFCKTCRRYWTHGGSLRNVPVGGGSRKKNKTVRSSTYSSPPPAPLSKDTAKIPILYPPRTATAAILLHSENPNSSNIGKFHGGQALSLSSDHLLLPTRDDDHQNYPTMIRHQNPSCSSPPSTSTVLHGGDASSAVELLNLNNTLSLGKYCYMNNMAVNDPRPDSNTSSFCMYSSLSSAGSIGLQELKPTVMHFSLDQHGNIGSGCGDAKQVPMITNMNANNQFEQGGVQGGTTSGGYYWSGLLGGETW